MGDNDAEWVGVDFEFGNHDPTTTTHRPRPHFPATPAPPTTREPPHDAPEVAASGPTTTPHNSFSPSVVGGAVGGGLGVVLLGLLVYMVVLRRRLSKARAADEAARYSLRVADVAHISHISHTDNTYVNTTDLQRFVAAVRAKDKSAARLPTPPRNALNKGFKTDSDVTVIRPPLPLPNSAPAHPAPAPLAPSLPLRNATPDSPNETESLYANLQESQPLAPLPSSRPPPPKIPPPPPPVRRQSDSGPTSPSVIARPAPPPPQPAQPMEVVLSTPQIAKPAPPPVSLKPSKPPLQIETASPIISYKPSAKPTPPTLPKPGRKGKALPPLKLVLTRGERDSRTTTPDTALTTLTPDTANSSSVTAKVAFLEGKVVLTPRPFPPNRTS